MDEKKHLQLKRQTHFREFQIWPLAEKLDIERWLSNFDPADVEMALRLLEGFVYICEPHTNALMKAAIQRFLDESSRLADPQFSAKTLSSNIAIVTVEGEKPRATDSGNLFARKARDILTVPDRQILRPQEAIEARSKFDTFIFVDDFVGSGNQMVETWRRRRWKRLTFTSFEKLSRAEDKIFAYCPAVTTLKGLDHLKRKAPNLKIFPAYTLSLEDGLLHPECPLWEGLSNSQVLHFLKTYSARAGYTAEDEGVEDWRGFHRLGIGLAFAHGIPDATLPIFYSRRRNWKPLARTDI